MQCTCENWEFIFFNLHFFLFTTLQGILSYALKGFFHINTFLGRRLKVWNISLWCTPSSSLFLWNLENQQKATCWIWSQMVSKSHKSHERGREGERAIISRKDIPLYYFHHLHRSCSLEQQMENFLDLRDLPAEGFSYHHHNCNFFPFI